MTGRKKINSKWLVLGCVMAVLCIVIAGVAVMLRGDEPLRQDQTVSAGMTLGNTDPASESASGDSATETRTATAPGGETVSVPETSPIQATQPTSPPPGPTEPVIQTPVTIPQQKEAPYEQWLAAGMIIGLSMEYPDFELQGIYLTGETPLEDRMNSDGVYILFTSGGSNMAIHGSPLEEGRKTPGTMDLSTQTIGFAAFDTVDAASVNTAAMTAVEIGELDELIAQSMLVSLYWN